MVKFLINPLKYTSDVEPSLVQIKLRYFFFISLIFVNSFSANSVELIVNKIENPIKLIDKYGNKFFLNNNYILKNGDFLNSKDKSSFLIFNDVKICLGVNSSFKFKEILNKNYTLFNLFKILFRDFSKDL